MLMIFFFQERLESDKIKQIYGYSHLHLRFLPIAFDAKLWLHSEV